MTAKSVVSSPVSRGPGRPRSTVARSQILRAAYDLLAEGGLHGFTIEAVSARSGAARTTVYRWWPSKAMLAMDAVLEVSDQTAPITETDDALADLFNHIRGVAGLFARGHGRVLSGILAEIQNDPTALELYRERLYRPRSEAAKRLLRRCIADGILAPDLDLDVTLSLLYGSLYMRLVLGQGGSVADPRWLDEVMSRLLHGLAAR